MEQSEGLLITSSIFSHYTSRFSTIEATLKKLYKFHSYQVLDQENTPIFSDRAFKRPFLVW